MKILFIGARLFDDVALYTRQNSIKTIITESNSESSNLELADESHLVSRGMEEPMTIAIKEDVDGVVPLIGIDGPLVEVAKMKELLEEDYGIPVAASGVYAASICADKCKTKDFFLKNNIKTPLSVRVSHNDYREILPKMLSEHRPVVLKQGEGQGGSGIKIVSSMECTEDYFNKFNSAMAEEYLDGIEVSIEVLRWRGKTVPLVPVYKGETSVEGIHPLRKIKKAPLKIDNIDNIRNNREIQKIAVKIAETMKIEGTADIDIIFNKENNENNVIEVNARPSGTRYITGAATNVNILQELVKMASNTWDPSKLQNEIKNYSSIEIPVGKYPSNKNNYKFREFSNKNSWIIHGPENHERVTIRDKTIEDAVKKARELEILVD
jgi:carbamoylphosphate synthase large subunit